MAAEVPLAAMIAMIRIMMMTVLLEDESHSRGAKSGIVRRVLGVGVMMIVSPGGLVGPGHNRARKEARIGRADLKSGGVRLMRLRAGAVSDRPSLREETTALGAHHQVPGVPVVLRRLLTTQ